MVGAGAGNIVDEPQLGELQRSKVVQRARVSAMCRSTSFVARVIYRTRGS